MIDKGIPGDLTDAELMTQVARGNGAMLGELYLRHGGAVRSAVCRWFPGYDRADADDLVQEVFLELGASAAKYKEQERFKAWLFTIAFRKAADLSRSLVRRNKDLAMREQKQMNLRDTADERPHDIRAEMRQAVGQMLSKLPEELREVLFLRAVEGFSAKEIGRITGVEETTARTRLHRARQQILDSADAMKWRQLLEGGNS